MQRLWNRKSCQCERRLFGPPSCGAPNTAAAGLPGLVCGAPSSVVCLLQLASVATWPPAPYQPVSYVWRINPAKSLRTHRACPVHLRQHSHMSAPMQSCRQLHAGRVGARLAGWTGGGRGPVSGRAQQRQQPHPAVFSDHKRPPSPSQVPCQETPSPRGTRPPQACTCAHWLGAGGASRDQLTCSSGRAATGNKGGWRVGKGRMRRGRAWLQAWRAGPLRAAALAPAAARIRQRRSSRPGRRAGAVCMQPREAPSPGAAPPPSALPQRPAAHATCGVPPGHPAQGGPWAPLQLPAGLRVHPTPVIICPAAPWCPPQPYPPACSHLPHPGSAQAQPTFSLRPGCGRQGGQHHRGRWRAAKRRASMFTSLLTHCAHCEPRVGVV